VVESLNNSNQNQGMYRRKWVEAHSGVVIDI